MIIEYYSELYPKRLKELKKPPNRLYALGNVEILKDIGIAVVGSRINTQYGEKMCKTFTKNLTEYNINIISGLAKGIDSIAHNTCLECFGKTIAVLPSGIENIYPKENIKLAKKILDNGGLIISEYEPYVEADSKKFLERNRIVAGLSIGTLVVEAGYRSGTKATARHTFKQNKPVFCIPCSLENKKGTSTNELIQKGANLVTTVEDILKFYKNLKFTKRILQKQSLEIDNISKELLDVYKEINKIPITPNEISRKTGLQISEVNYKILMLQLDELIIELAGCKFVRKYT